MKNTKLNYEFSIRSIEDTTNKHIEHINKLKKDKQILKKILDQLEENNISEIWQNHAFVGYSYAYGIVKRLRVNKTQKDLKALKNPINYVTRAHIEYLLQYYNIPKSYATAFYCIYYNRINKLMKRNLKEMIK